MALEHTVGPQRARPIRRSVRMRAFVLVSLGCAAILVSHVPPAAWAIAVTEDIPAEEFIGVSEAEAACIGEDVTFTGNVHLTGVANGSTSKLVLALHHVVGTGVETGARYSIVGTQQLFFGQDEVVRATFNIVGGRHRVFEFLLINAQGHVVDRSFICR